MDTTVKILTFFAMFHEIIPGIFPEFFPHNFSGKLPLFFRENSEENFRKFPKFPEIY